MKTTGRGMQKILKRMAGKPGNLKKVTMSVTIKKIDSDKQIVTGEVYAPYILDSHGEMMEPEDVEFMAHEWVSKGLNSYDIMHNNIRIKAETVESFIAKGHPDWNEGAWVLSTHISDKRVWKDIKSGKLSGYSIEAMCHKLEGVVEYESTPFSYGYVEKHDGHDHAFFLTVNKQGVVTGGFTSYDNGHRHIIKFGTRTEEEDGHSHRFFL